MKITSDKVRSPWDSNNRITWKLVRNMNSQVPPQNYRIRNSGDEAQQSTVKTMHMFLTSLPRDSHAHLSLRTTALGNQNSIKERSKIKV